MMVKFSIFLLTYNRPVLVKKTINSIIEQSYSNFEILLFDNGSEIPVQSLDGIPDDPRIKFFRFDSNQNGNDLGEMAIEHMTGTHFLFLADDDVLTPDTLKIVSDVFIQNPQIELLNTGLAFYHHDDSYQKVTIFQLSSFTGKLEEYDGKEAGFFYCNNWGIGRKKKYKAPRMSHSSGCFMSVELLKKTREKQRELFIKPFGDIGFVGLCFNTPKVYYLDLPLVIIGITQTREMNGAKPGNRSKWDKEKQWIEHSGIKGSSFINMGADGHLKVLLRNNLDKEYICKLRPDFYRRHLKQVITDSPWTRTTLEDIIECIPKLFMSFFIFFSWEIFLGLLFLPLLLPLIIIIVLVNSFKRHIKQHAQRTEVHAFEDVNDYAQWINENYVQYGKSISC